MIVDERRYTEEEVDEILKLALQRGHRSGEMDRRTLESAAAEMGISADDLARAEREVLERRDEEGLFTKFRKFKWNAFLGHLGTYVAVNAGIAFMFQFPGWQWWVLGGWGIGLLSDLFSTLNATQKGSAAFEIWKRIHKGTQGSAPQPLVAPDQLSGADKDLILAEYIRQGGLRDRFAAAQHLRDQTGLNSDQALEAVNEFRDRHPNVLS